MPNFTENSRKKSEKFTDTSWAPMPLFQVAMLMQKYKLFIHNQRNTPVWRHKWWAALCCKI